MRFVQRRLLTDEEEETAIECMTRRRNGISHEKYSDEVEANIRTIDENYIFPIAVGAFYVDFERNINGARYEYVTKFMIKTRGKIKIKSKIQERTL